MPFCLKKCIFVINKAIKIGNMSELMQNKHESFSKNEKQFTFNEIKGIIHEMNDQEEWCSITLNVGHETQRFVNLAIKKVHFDSIKSRFKTGDRALIRFYLTSRFKNERWYTTANILEVSSI